MVNQSLVLRINICGKIATFAKPQNVGGQAMTTHKQNDNNEKNNYLGTSINDNNNIDYGTI